MIRTNRLITGFALWLFLSMPTAMSQILAGRGSGTSYPEAETIVVGRVAKDPASQIPRLQALANYLASHLQEFGIRQGKVEIAKDNFQMVQYIRHGIVDVVSETPLSACMFEEEAQAEILLREWKGGVSHYFSVFFTRKDSLISKLSDLQDKVIAFEDPGSTSAFLLPYATLKRSGFELVALSSPKVPPPKNTVGYIFSGDEFGIAIYVHRGIAAAGALSNLDWLSLEKTTPHVWNALRIIYATKPIIHSVVVVRGDLEHHVKDALTKILVNIAEDPLAEELLKSYYNTTKYDRIGGNLRKHLDDACATYRSVRHSLN